MLRLDPHLAVFRTSPDRIAIGAQQPVAQLDADAPTLRAIAALTRGVLPRELGQLIGEVPAQTLLEVLEPAIVEAVAPVATLVRGRIPLAEQLHRAARAAGHPTRVDGEGVIVPVAPWRLPARELERLLDAGDAHLPVVVGDAWLQVGPFVPSGGGCAQCARPAGDPLLPGHLTPVASPIAASQAVVTLLEALRRASEGALSAGWAVRIRQRDGAVSAVRRRRCSHRAAQGSAARSRPAAERSRRGTATAA
ncbi:hypothetical protein [Agrococcus sp. ARC_14]|uniref:hypothetical protein n=1 Tax=Agrococcus sp. ARC_14 TaxID=2919927 RepID=UPI001F06BCB7|nr:hypothetical protein [Agrococcus sp. ARC_14]MCH1882633.1 hypothetical protein [Agrococcus sp. ARC_14]